MTWTPSRFIAAFVGLWLVLMPIVAVMPAAAMESHTSMTLDDDAGAGGCGYPEHGGVLCMMICLNTALLGLAPELLGFLAVGRITPDEGRSPILRGRVPILDPAPPKAAAL